MMKKWLFYIATCAALQTAFATDRAAELTEHVKHCLTLAEQKTSGVTSDAALNIEGMSGHKVKHFLNNLCTLPHTSYLEIGCWKGSTLVAALYGNQATVDHAIAIDNWSEFGGPKYDFLWITQKHLPEDSFEFYEADCFSMQKSGKFPLPVNIYFYDGGHSAKEQEKAFTYFNDIFEDVFIAVVDDWNGDGVREGTFSAFAKLNYNVVFDREIRTAYQDGAGWWNGLYVAVIKK